MYKYILELTDGINALAIFAMVTFFLVFLIAIYLAFIKNNDEIKHAAELPLIDDDSTNE